MLKGFCRQWIAALALAASLTFVSSSAFGQHHGGGHAGGGHAGGGHMSGSHMGGHTGGMHHGGVGGGSYHHGGSLHYGGYGGYGGFGYGGYGGLGGFGYGLGGLGYSSLGYGGYGLGYSSLYGNSYGYGSGYSGYSGYGSYAPQYYSARPVANVYVAPTYNYAQPQAYRVQGYANSAPVNPAASGSDLRPGMVLPDGAVVTSVGPIH